VLGTLHHSPLMVLLSPMACEFGDSTSKGHEMSSISDAMRLCTRAELMAIARVSRDTRNDAGRGFGAVQSAVMWAALDEIRERDRLAGELDERMMYGRF
jgi:hypothetical protein